MSLIPASIRSSLGLHVSSNELSKLEKMDVKNIRNIDIARLDKTLLTTKKTVKQENITRLKEKISDQKYGGIFDTTRENIKKEISTLSDKGTTKNVLKTLNKDAPISTVIAGSNNEVVGKSAVIRDFQLVGVDLGSTLPSNYRELFVSIRASFPDNNIVNGMLEKYDARGQLDNTLKPNATKKILSTLFSLPQNQEKIAHHFGGQLDTAWDQSSMLKSIQIGKSGLCSSLAMKWCADKYQGIPFFNDIKTKEGLDEVVHLKIDKGGEPYLHARGLAFSAHETTLNVEKAGFHLIGLTPKESGYGHEVAAVIDDKTKQYKYFDPNLGEFSFPTAETMKSFIQTSSARIYTDLKLSEDLVLTPIKQ